MPIISRPVAGPYEWLLGNDVDSIVISGDGVSLGVVEDAVTLRVVTAEEEVIGDNLGRGTIQGLVGQGHTAYLDFVFQERERAAVQKAMWPYVANYTGVIPGRYGSGGTLNLTADTVGKVRRFDPLGNGTYGAFAIVATAISNPTSTTAAVFNLATQTWPPWIWARAATLAPNQNLSLIFGSRLSPLAVSFLLLPATEPAGSPAAGQTASAFGSAVAPAPQPAPP